MGWTAPAMRIMLAFSKPIFKENIMAIKFLAINLAKNLFQLHGVDAAGQLFKAPGWLGVERGGIAFESVHHRTGSSSSAHHSLRKKTTGHQ